MEYRDLKKQYEKLKDDIDTQIADVIRETHFISGSQVNELEKKLAEYVGVKHCITCGNGTDAITLALMAWNIGKGDAVFVPDFTFFSTGESPACLEATPIFVDVSERTYNIDPLKLEQAIIRIKTEGKLVPKVVVAVDLFGQPADYAAIKSICEKYNLFLLEDGAQGFGGEIRGRKACSFGDISTTSFFPAKPLGCYGDGGAIFTDNDEWNMHIRSFCVHGRDTSNLSDPDAKYNNIRLGMNSRLDTLQAAILLAKFQAFKKYELETVNRLATLYTDKLQNLKLSTPFVPEGFISSWAQYTVCLQESVDRKKLQCLLKEKGIPTMIYYMKPMHQQRAFAGTESENAICPVTEKLCKTVLSLPMHPYLTHEDVNFVADEMRNVLRAV